MDKIKPNDGYVYLIGDSNDNVKVGHSISVASRLRSLRTGNIGIKLVAAIRTDQCILLESFLHEHLKEYHVNGEWYKGINSVTSKVIEYIKKHGEIFKAFDIYFPAPDKPMSTLRIRDSK